MTTNQNENITTAYFAFGLVGLVVAGAIISSSGGNDIRSETTQYYNNNSSWVLPRSADQLHACKNTYEDPHILKLADDKSVAIALDGYRTKCLAIAPEMKILKDLTESYYASGLASTDEEELPPTKDVENALSSAKKAYKNLSNRLSDSDNASDELIRTMVLAEISRLPKTNLEDERFATRLDNLKRSAKVDDIQATLNIYSDFRKLYSSVHGVELPDYYRPGSALRLAI